MAKAAVIKFCVRFGHEKYSPSDDQLSQKVGVVRVRWPILKFHTL